MSDQPNVSVIEVEHPITVAVDTGTPIISITDNTKPASTVVVQAKKVTAVIADHKPEVHVRIGRGSLSDRTLLMELLTDQMDITLLSPELRDDIFALRDFFGRMGQNIYDYMTDADIERILQTAATYTDEKIQFTAMDITRLEEGIDANMADIEITARSIESQVTALKWQTDGSFAAQNSLIDQTAEHIESTVLRLDNLMHPDGTQGLIVQMQSQINQEADKITHEVLAREALDGKVTEQSTMITQTALAIESVATATDEAANRLNTSEERLTASEKVISILSKGLNEGAYSIETIMALTASSMGVTIEETVGGVPYLAGFEVIMYPTWLTDTPYTVGDRVTFAEDNNIYRCILDHTSLGSNSPGSVDADTYWVFEPEKERTEFNVHADHFQIVTPEGLVPVFDVNGVTGKVTINGALVVQTLKSLDYDAQSPSQAWFILDPVTGKAEFNNMSMTFGSPEKQTEFIENLGIVVSTIYDWTGSVPIPINGHLDLSHEWSFNSDYADGALIEVEVDDDFAGELHIALNGLVLTVDLFGDHDFGDTIPSASLFTGESDAINHNDLSTGGKTFDLGGF